MRSIPPTGWNIGIAWSHSCSNANRTPTWEASSSDTSYGGPELPGLLGRAGRLGVPAVRRSGVPVVIGQAAEVRGSATRASRSPALELGVERALLRPLGQQLRDVAVVVGLRGPTLDRECR